MNYTLPPLPYAYDALEPYIDALTMEIHHNKHHQAYVNNLNAALKDYPDIANIPLEELLSDLTLVPEAIRDAVRNNGGGNYNHSLFWTIMGPDTPQKPTGKLAQAIEKTFGSFDAFKELFSNEAKKRFGSGWAWLSVDPQGKLVVTSTLNQDSPLSEGLVPIMGLDVWEHAYYLHYQNRRPDYISAWWHVINWPEVEKNYISIVGS